jgi:hypothetical protein
MFMAQIRQHLRRLFSLPWIARLVALAGGIVFLLQLWRYAHTQSSVLDEGLYLYKGWLFASGRYQPFQDYGPLTNHMPLAFLIPGYIQLWFGHGLRTGRYFAILISLLMLLGLWITARRFGGKWLAAGAVWAIALNPAVAKLSSMAISEGLIACMMMWVMVLVLGENRPRWQVILGGGLAALLVMTRVNLLPTLPFTLLYIFWQHGRKTGIWATVLGGAVFVLLHVLYWPNILRLWAYWVPTSISPFLNTFRPPAEALPSWDPNVAFRSRIMSFLQAFRYHTLAISGALASWALWRRNKSWKTQAYMRAAIFLSILFITLVLLHAWASLGDNYCVYCFPIYFNFFAALGLLMLVISLASWQGNLSRLGQSAVFLIVIGLCTAIGLGMTSDLNQKFPELTKKASAIKVPGFLPSGGAEVWVVLVNKFGLSDQVARQLLRSLQAALLGLGVGVAILLLAWLIRRFFAPRVTYSNFLLVFFLVVALVFTPTFALGGAYTSYDCSGDTLAAYDAVGEYLASVIPAGAQIYWKGGLSPVPLLYLPDARIYPPQLNGDYSLRLGGEADALLRYGWWSQPLAIQWADEADIILIEDKYYSGWLLEHVSSPDYVELPISPPVAACRSDSRIHIFQRRP